MGHSKRRAAAKQPPFVPAEFPLWWHRASGRWCRKVRGKFHYFGRDPDKALAEWLRVKDHLLAGRRPPPSGQEVVAVADVAEAFLNSRRRKLEAGELARETLRGYVETMTRMVGFFGADRPVADLGPEDFAQLRADFARTHGPAALGCDVQQVRTCFRWAVEAELIPALPKFGADFKKPPARVLRAALNGKRRNMTRTEILAMLDGADVFLRCYILLGVNCGFGPHDVAVLPRGCVDLDRAWLEFPRPKTAVARKAWLWPETVAALREYEAVRPRPGRPEYGEFFFLSKWRRPIAADGAKNQITAWFRALARAVGVYRPGLSAYSLRHTFRHVADQALDQVAAGIVMGHVDRGIAATYRGDVPAARVQAVCGFVRAWFFDEGPDQAGDEAGDGPDVILFQRKIG